MFGNFNRSAVSMRFIALGLIAGAVLGAVVGLVVLFRTVTAQREAEMVVWQSRLGQLAEQQTFGIDRWINTHFTTLRALADNASLQIYMTTLTQGGSDSDVVLAQRKFLTDLLTVTAERNGFTERAALPPELTNEQQIGHAGIALLAPDRHVLAATDGMPPLAGRFGDAVAALPEGRRGFIDFTALADGQVVLGFLEPIYAIQSEPATNQLVGYVLGVTKPDADLLAALKLEEPHPASEKATVVRVNDGMVEYLLPLAGTGQIPQRRLSRATTDLDTAFATDHPGDFAEKIDDSGMHVLVTGRATAIAPWFVAETVSVDEALAVTDAQARRNAVYLLLGAMLIIATILAAWRHGSSRRLAAMAEEYRGLAERFEQQHQRLRVITDTQSDAIYIVDHLGKAQFANRAFAARLGIAAEDCVDKSLNALVGPAAASETLDAVARCLAEGVEIRETIRRGQGAETKIVHIAYVPLPHGESDAPAALVVERDVTAAMEERERRAKTLDQLIAALVAAIDVRDHLAAHQSARVAALSRGIAEELGLGATLVATAETAGRLMNFGKALVPPELLMRAGKLTPEELETVRKSIAATADIVSSVEFDGPVVHTLRDASERWDGSGPRGLRGEEIPVAARIVAVANSFVAAAMPRAYREAAGVDRAVEEILAEAGTVFDRRVVSALTHFIDNRGGRALFEPAPPTSPTGDDHAAR